jgi:hypothetical protein
MYNQEKLNNLIDDFIFAKVNAKDMFNEEIILAREQYAIALQDFNYAEPSFIDTAIYNLFLYQCIVHANILLFFPDSASNLFSIVD